MRARPHVQQPCPLRRHPPLLQNRPILYYKHKRTSGASSSLDARISSASPITSRHARAVPHAPAPFAPPTSAACHEPSAQRVAAAAAAVVRLTASAKSMRGKSRAVGGARCGSAGSKAAALRLQSAAQRAASPVRRTLGVGMLCAVRRCAARHAVGCVGSSCWGGAKRSLACRQWTRCNAAQADGSEQL